MEFCCCCCSFSHLKSIVTKSIEKNNSWNCFFLITKNDTHVMVLQSIYLNFQQSIIFDFYYASFPTSLPPNKYTLKRISFKIFEILLQSLFVYQNKPYNVHKSEGNRSLQKNRGTIFSSLIIQCALPDRYKQANGTRNRKAKKMREEEKKKQINCTGWQMLHMQWWICIS